MWLLKLSVENVTRVLYSTLLFEILNLYEFNVWELVCPQNVIIFYVCYKKQVPNYNLVKQTIGWLLRHFKINRLFKKCHRFYSYKNWKIFSCFWKNNQLLYEATNQSATLAIIRRWSLGISNSGVVLHRPFSVNLVASFFEFESSFYYRWCQIKVLGSFERK